MGKPCYEEYANHAMRFYTRNLALNLSKPGLTKTDVANWNACNDAIQTFSQQEQTIIMSVYKSKCIMTDAVHAMAGQLHMSEGVIWQLLGRFSKEFAKKRGLI